ncbi:MAG TPA: cytosolic protein [Elusimicrobia bacterium]|nr:cytosolic protein [Elusimicrobiota bacterium]
MKKECLNSKANLAHCNCTYTSCDRKGNCCECLQYHRRNNELPACFFPNDVEKTYDRSYERFIETLKK